MCSPGIAFALGLGVISLAASNLLVIIRVVTLWDHSKASNRASTIPVLSLNLLLASQNYTLYYLHTLRAEQRRYDGVHSCPLPWYRRSPDSKTAS